MLPVRWRAASPGDPKRNNGGRRERTIHHGAYVYRLTSRRSSWCAGVANPAHSVAFGAFPRPLGTRTVTGLHQWSHSGSCWGSLPARSFRRGLNRVHIRLVAARSPQPSADHAESRDPHPPLQGRRSLHTISNYAGLIPASFPALPERLGGPGGRAEHRVHECQTPRCSSGSRSRAAKCTSTPTSSP